MRQRLCNTVPQTNPSTPTVVENKATIHFQAHITQGPWRGHLKGSYSYFRKWQFTRSKFLKKYNNNNLKNISNDQILSLYPAIISLYKATTDN